MKSKAGLIALLLFALLLGCKKDWEEHYTKIPVASNENMWDAMQADPELTRFVGFIKEFHYDTLFSANNTYSLFAPTNDAFNQFLTSDSFTRNTLNYLINQTYIQSNNIQGSRKVLTLSKKYALLVNQGLGLQVDGIPVTFESPLYKNGKYFKIGKVDVPLPNLYEYYALTNPVLKKYIDSQDSIVLDKALSKPIGFDDQGNTIYDSVTYIDNKFEDKYFPVKHESRYNTATIVFPKEEDYNNALTQMALSFNSPLYHDYNDIPIVWQNEILIPYLLEHGVFPNLVEPIEFKQTVPGDTVKIKNVLGDSIVINYTPKDKAVCSNGYAYNYTNFTIPDTLSKGITRKEGESLLYPIGVNRYAYLPDVHVTSSQAFQPQNQYILGASNDSVLNVNFPKGYTGTYTITFNVPNLFPRKYQMIVRTNVNEGGIYNIYVNGVLMKTFDYYYYVLNANVYTSVTGKRYATKGGFNIFDCWVTGLTEYGKTQVTFEYVGPSTVLYNGLVIDYISFVPY